MRINKFISEAGKSSRRGADKSITEGRVFVNGKRADLGIRVESDDDVRYDGNPTYIALNNDLYELNQSEVNLAMICEWMEIRFISLETTFITHYISLLELQLRLKKMFLEILQILLTTHFACFILVGWIKIRTV